MADAERHPNSLANLKPFEPGESGNPSGRPKGSHSVRTALKRKLRKGWQEDEESEDGEKVGTWARQLAEDVAQAIDEGDADKIRSIATIIDQVEGKPQERVEHSGGGKAISIILEETPSDPEPL